MPKWIPCGGKFITGDVVRWIEPVWVEKGRRKKTLVKVGMRAVTAAVLKDEGREFASLSVLKCEVLDTIGPYFLQPLKKDAVVKRKRMTIARGGGERLPWTGKDGEGARALVTSKFLD